MESGRIADGKREQDAMLNGTHSVPSVKNEFLTMPPLALLRRAPIVLGNLEGPFAEKVRKQQRNFSYRVEVSLASSLSRAGINVVTLANNHLMDCGRSGVLETLDALSNAKVLALGAGTNEREI